jgi:hypothetical protein
LAKQTGMSKSTVARIWRAFGLKPHLVDTFKLSTDPQFIDKVRDLVGLYLNPPQAAVVLCVDEKTQVQAVDRTQPVLPLLPGVPQRRTHDDTRHGTTNLYAALNLASGLVISQMTARHRAVEFKRFWSASMLPCRPSWTCTWSSTTPRPTRRRRSNVGWLPIPASTCTSRRPTARG